MLSALKLLSLNPWVILGVLLALATSHASAFFYGVSVGGNREALKCERRVTAIKDDLDKKNKEVEAINQKWQEAIDKLADGYNEVTEADEKAIAELEAKLKEYTDGLAPSDACLLTDDDARRLQ